MPVPLTRRELIEREVVAEHVATQSLTPVQRRLAMGLPLYACSCGRWSAETIEGFREHFDAEVTRRVSAG